MHYAVHKGAAKVSEIILVRTIYSRQCTSSNLVIGYGVDRELDVVIGVNQTPRSLNLKLVVVNLPLHTVDCIVV